MSPLGVGLVAYGVSRSSTSDLWGVLEQHLVVLPILTRDCHPPQSTSWGPHTCPSPSRGSGHPDWTLCRGAGPPRPWWITEWLQEQSQELSRPILSPVSPAPRPSPAPLLCQALLCQRPLAPGKGYLALQSWQEAPRILLPSGSVGHGHPCSVPMGRCHLYSTFPSDQ